jgi:CBS domain-containing protein
LSFFFDGFKATKYSMRTGQVFGVIFAVTGLFLNPFLLVIGIFVFIGAGLEYTQVKFHSLLFGYKAKDIVMEDYSVLDSGETLKNAVDILLKTRQKGFFVKKDDDIVGLLVKDNIIEGLSKYGQDVKVNEVMTKDFKKVDANRPLSDIFKTLQKEKSDILPVFENQKLIGVIDLENLQEFFMVKSALREE